MSCCITVLLLENLSMLLGAAFSWQDDVSVRCVPCYRSYLQLIARRMRSYCDIFGLRSQWLFVPCRYTWWHDLSQNSGTCSPSTIRSLALKMPAPDVLDSA